MIAPLLMSNIWITLQHELADLRGKLKHAITAAEKQYTVVSAQIDDITNTVDYVINQTGYDFTANISSLSTGIYKLYTLYIYMIC